MGISPNVARVKKMVFLLCLLAGCASAPQTPEQQAAAVGGATGCLAQGVMAAGDTGKGEMIVVGLVLMPFCALIASANPQSVSAFAPRPIGFYGGGTPKGPGGLASRK